MKKRRGVFIQFLLTYFLSAIPVLIVSILAARMITEARRQVEEDALKTRLEDAQNKFVSLWKNYQEESALMANRTELAPRRMLGSSADTYEGIKFLRLKNDLDGNIDSVFAVYETEWAYTSMGTARLDTWFSSILGCEEESIKRGIKAVESSASEPSILYRNNSNGWILFSYKPTQKDGVTTGIHFLIPFSYFYESFLLSYPYQYYELTMPDGSSLTLGTNDSGDMAAISREEWLQSEGKADYEVLEGEASSLGITFKLYYDRKHLWLGEWFSRMQGINMALILLGIALSTLLSGIFARRRSRELSWLENAAQGESLRSLSERNVYYGLQEMILQGVHENQKLEERVTANEEKLRERVSFMILSGLFWEPDGLELAFRELGFSGVWDRFFAGAVSISGQEKEEALEYSMPSCIWAPMVYRGKRYYIFLHELEKDDQNQLQRRAIAEEIRKRFEEQGIHKVYVGISRVFSNPLMIHYACEGAARTLEHMIQGKSRDYCVCQEGEEYRNSVMPPDLKALERFDDALGRKDYEDARGSFRDLLYECSMSGCSRQNEIYLRYVILQHIAAFLRQEKGDEAVLLAEECVNVNPEQEREFTGSVLGILQRSLAVRKDDSLGKILNYIADNYQRSDLSYEEVAEAGGVSKTYISRLFRNNFGTSYIEYLTWVRLEKACILLRTTDQNISMVAETVGYANVANFRKAFKARYGISASDYRRREKEYKEEK